MNNTNEGINFVVMPIEIFNNKDLTPTEKMLYGYISIFKSQCCYQSNETIASKLGVGERSITRGLKKLEELGYVFIEFVNGSNHKRRIYVLLDNPKKIKYLIKKGLLNREEHKSFPQGFPQSRQIGEMAKSSSQIGEISSQIGEMADPCSSSQIGEQRIKEYKKSIANDRESSTGGLAGGCQPPDRCMPKLSDFASREEWEKAFYAWNSASLPQNA